MYAGVIEAIVGEHWHTDVQVHKLESTVKPL